MRNNLFFVTINIFDQVMYNVILHYLMNKHFCFRLPGLFPACQMTVKKPEPSISTGSGLDLDWLMSICPIIQSYLASLVPRPTPSLTGQVTSVSCQMGSLVISVDQVTYRNSSSPMQPTQRLEVSRYSYIHLILTFPKPKVASPSWLLQAPPAPPPLHHHSVRLPASSAPGQ